MARKGYCPTEEHRRNLSLVKKGKNNYNWKGGLPSCEICEKKLSIYSAKRCVKHPSDETLRKRSIALSGENNPNFGKHPSEETTRKRRVAKLGEKNLKYWLGKHRARETVCKVKNTWRQKYANGYTSPRKGILHTVESIRKMSLAKVGKVVSKETREKMGLSHEGEKSHFWKGGISFEPYPLGWNKTFKEQIRYRDGYRCQLCGVPEIECIKKLHVHHKDYVKKNIEPSNLISLCNSCHVKTNCNREYWIRYFKTNILEKRG